MPDQLSTTPLCGTCRDHPDARCDICGNNLSPGRYPLRDTRTEAERPPFDNGSSLVAMANQDRDQREQIELIREAIHRVNIDWDEVARNCGDPKCHGDCRWVRVLRSV
jgi:hypothetical protein